MHALSDKLPTGPLRVRPRDHARLIQWAAAKGFSKKVDAFSALLDMAFTPADGGTSTVPKNVPRNTGQERLQTKAEVIENAQSSS